MLISSGLVMLYTFHTHIQKSSIAKTMRKSRIRYLYLNYFDKRILVKVILVFLFGLKVV